ncbi:MAG: BON domain-containing protein, partial [Vicinamibacterales bacterium]
MTTALLNATDLRVRSDVLRQLEWDSEVEASAIAASAHDGVVTLTGTTDSYAGKLAAERAAKRVRGVRAVANEVRVRLRLERTDTEIAADAARLLGLRGLPESVQAVVHDGHVTLTGTVPTLFQWMLAEKALRHIAGLQAIVNRVIVVPRAPARSARRELQRALERHAVLAGLAVTATVDHGVVTLSGNVRSWQARDTAEA